MNSPNYLKLLHAPQCLHLQKEISSPDTTTDRGPCSEVSTWKLALTLSLISPLLLSLVQELLLSFTDEETETVQFITHFYHRVLGFKLKVQIHCGVRDQGGHEASLSLGGMRKGRQPHDTRLRAGTASRTSDAAAWFPGSRAALARERRPLGDRRAEPRRGPWATPPRSQPPVPRHASG